MPARARLRSVASAVEAVCGTLPFAHVANGATPQLVPQPPTSSVTINGAAGVLLRCNPQRGSTGLTRSHTSLRKDGAVMSRHRRIGFTLVELLVVIGIIAILI